MIGFVSSPGAWIAEKFSRCCGKNECARMGYVQAVLICAFGGTGGVCTPTPLVWRLPQCDHVVEVKQLMRRRAVWPERQQAVRQ